MVGPKQHPWKGDLQAQVRALKGSIAFLIDELVEMLLEGDGHCSGPLRRQLAAEFRTLQACLREILDQPLECHYGSQGVSQGEPDHKAAGTLHKAEVFLLKQIQPLYEEVDCQSLSLSRLLRIKTEFRKLIQSGGYRVIQ